MTDRLSNGCSLALPAEDVPCRLAVRRSPVGKSLAQLSRERETMSLMDGRERVLKLE